MSGNQHPSVKCECVETFIASTKQLTLYHGQSRILAIQFALIRYVSHAHWPLPSCFSYIMRDQLYHYYFALLFILLFVRQIFHIQISLDGRETIAFLQSFHHRDRCK